MTQPTAELPAQTSIVERAVTVLLLVGLGIVAVIASFLGLLFSMVSDGCGGDAVCNSDQIGYGIVIASGSPILMFIVAVAQVVKRFRRRLSAWWVPLAAFAAGAVLFVVGGIVAATAVG